MPEHEWTEEYDYVRLESRTAVGRRNAEIRAALPDKLRASFDALVRDADHAGEVRHSIFYLDLQLVIIFFLKVIESGHISLIYHHKCL